MFRPCMPRSTLHFRSLGLAVFAQKPGLDSRPCPGEQPPPHWNTQDRYQIETRRSLQQYIDYFPVTVQTCRDGMISPARRRRLKALKSGADSDPGYKMQDARCKMQSPLWNASSGRIGFVSWILYLFAEARLPALSGDKFHCALDWNVNGAFGLADPPITVEKFELIGIELL